MLEFILDMMGAEGIVSAMPSNPLVVAEPFLCHTSTYTDITIGELLGVFFMIADLLSTLWVE